jgi:hypothetical protein
LLINVETGPCPSAINFLIWGISEASCLCSIIICSSKSETRAICAKTAEWERGKDSSSNWGDFQLNVHLPHWLFQDDNEPSSYNPWLTRAISFASYSTRIEWKYIWVSCDPYKYALCFPVDNVSKFLERVQLQPALNHGWDNSPRAFSVGVKHKLLHARSI